MISRFPLWRIQRSIRYHAAQHAQRACMREAATRDMRSMVGFEGQPSKDTILELLTKACLASIALRSYTEFAQVIGEPNG